MIANVSGIGLVIAITIVYALILPVLLLVPRHLIATADGQAPEVGSDLDQGRQGNVAGQRRANRQDGRSSR